MISWIQTTFQQHFRIIFAVLLVLVIVSFVFTIGASPGIGRAERQISRRDYFGVNLGSQEAITRVVGDAELSVYLQAGYAAVPPDQLQDYALQRHAGLYLADQLHLPQPTAAEIGDHIRTLGAFAGEDGQFSQARYDEFRANIRANAALREGDVTRVIADDVRYNRLQRLLAGPGYVLPSEVRTQLARSDAEWTIAVASADYSAFSPAIEPTEAEVTKYFEDNLFRYETSPQVRLRYVPFPVTAYLPRVSVTDAEVRAYYDANPAQFPAPAETPAPTVGETSDAAYTAVKPQVEAALRSAKALQLAAKDASDLSLAMFENKVGLDSVDSFLANRQLNAVAVAPFGQNSVPAELGSNPQVAAEALALNSERFYSDAIPVPGGAAVLLWQETIPPRQPAFATVADRVRADYVEAEKRKRFVDAGRTVRDQLRSRVAAGATFESAAAAVTALPLTVKVHADFTRRQPPADLQFAAVNALDLLQEGEISDLINTGEQGLFVYAIDKQDPDMSAASDQFSSVKSQLAQVYASRTGGEYLYELVERELAKTAPAVP